MPFYEHRTLFSVEILSLAEGGQMPPGAAAPFKGTVAASAALQQTENFD